MDGPEAMPWWRCWSSPTGSGSRASCSAGPPGWRPRSVAPSSAVAPAGALDASRAGEWGADQVVVMTGGGWKRTWPAPSAGWCERRQPWAVLAPGTMWGREVASRLAARLGAGLTGDAVDLAVDGGRMVGWKPAFGGRLVAAVTATSPVQLATVRPGMLPLSGPRPGEPVPVTSVRDVAPSSRVRRLARAGRTTSTVWPAPEAVVGVGTGVGPGRVPGCCSRCWPPWAPSWPPPAR